MRICFVLPRLPLVQKVQQLMQKEFKHISAEYLLYDDYKTVYRRVQEVQNNFDAILFSGYLPYIYSAEAIKQEVIWSYIPRVGSTLLTALTTLARDGYDLRKISFDTYGRDVLKEVYGELGYDDEFEPLLYEGDPLDDAYVEKAIEFHKNNLRTGRAQIALTLIYIAQRQLSEEHMPVHFALQTANIIREQIQRLEYYAQMQKLEAEQVAILIIGIDFPPEYLLMQETSERYLNEKHSIEKRIYKAADQVRGFVVELSPNSYMILSSAALVKKETGDYRYLTLIDALEKYTLYTVSVGIGQGTNVAQARKNAIAAMLTARKHKNNSAYVRLSDGRTLGPLNSAPQKRRERDITDIRLDKIAERTGMSVNTIYAIYAFSSGKPDGKFTAMELAESLNISKRSADRFLRRLEDGGYVKVEGQRLLAKSGRPTRILRFYLKV